ncbi:MAG: thiamine biosynthesis protein ApbE [Bacteroidetes bacterium GWF2_42_66]|nr:MAG: thiamine biosynthesis protein ApbE [Bacteroidetes bacterium GWA2_42_15]OFY00339.1 MAG: thiamine biosynthesis protein ApbE [Bacteroidetes bacterium GWE2_42_39]OFY47091.1 MAG: thiamine biosynthesis protein ApbE [Bacteroidetes bacterium GWF2_42_66]HBL76735.1 thiamine biosynthesis protein ApbE [Prolixibacteraceae bacterium]HCR91691.1 thiamine biosynthesis protein ApbE [Prolixibacteraceae bacterium]
MRLLVSLFLILISAKGFSQETFMRTLKLMGSRYEITVVANNQPESEKFIDMAVNEITRIEKLISEWDPNSQTSKINSNAGVAPVKVDPELFHLIERAIQISKITDGAFDISYAAMDKIWKFDGSLQQMPDEETIRQSVLKVGYKNIILNKEDGTVFLKLPGMKIGFGAIGKGYSADKAKDFLMKEGVVAGMVNASGDLNCWGKKSDGKPWLVGITNPLNKNKVFSWFPIENSAVVTSGDYEKYVVLNGKRYAHIIDPRTGYPAHGLTSVSIFAPNAELADALATGVFVMGIEAGLNLVNQLKGIECVLVDDQGKIYYSENIERKTKEQ